MKLVLPARYQPEVTAVLAVDPGLDIFWYQDILHAAEGVSDADVLWIAYWPSTEIAAILERARRLRWLSTHQGGVNPYPLAEIRRRGITFTNGAGIHAIPMAEFAVLGMLSMVRELPRYVRAQDRGEWLRPLPPGDEVFGSKVLIIGYGQIGRAIGDRLRGFGVDVTGVRRHPEPGETGVIGADAWRARLQEFDWIVLSAPLTDETRQVLGPAELASLKPGAKIVNLARGALIDQDTLIAGLRSGKVGGAVLDVWDPEPIPPDSPLWTTPNVLITAHGSGVSARMPARAAALFAENLGRFQRGEAMLNLVDTALGY